MVLESGAEALRELVGDLADVDHAVRVADRDGGEAQPLAADLDLLVDDLAARPGDRDQRAVEARRAHLDADGAPGVADLAVDGPAPGHDRDGASPTRPSSQR